jgi:hypothetical protein
MREGESLSEAALRCLQDELRIPPGDVQLIKEIGKIRTKVKESESYPGLKGLYSIHCIEALVKELPDGAFETAEGCENDPITRHHWDWEEAESVLQRL